MDRPRKRAPMRPYHKKSGPTGDRQQAWQAMRVMRRFTSHQLRMVIDGAISARNLAKYLVGLERCGYLRVVAPRLRGVAGSCQTYQLCRDSGPVGPILWNNGQCWDCNEEKVYGDPLPGHAALPGQEGEAHE